MEKCKTEEVAVNCLLKARNYAQAEKWTRAFPHYLMCLEMLPNNRSQYEEEFTEVLYQLGILLELRGQVTEVVKWYTIGLKYFPSCSKILNNFGESLLRTEQPELALTYLKSACALDRNFLLAEKNLLTAKVNALPRWHFRMLNDRIRNEAYRAAIHNVITPEYNRVLDIGAGCGLLSFYASECKDTQAIAAIESSPTLSTIATNVLKGGNVIVINKHSSLLNSSTIGLSNVLITEIFDAGLFGEHALKTLIHAWGRLLKPSAKIVPYSADLFVTGISSTTILSRHKLCKIIPELKLNNVCVRQRTAEPYEAENLKQKNVNYITNTKKALHVDFTNIKQLETIYKEMDSIPVFKLTCKKSGTIDAFAIWFDLHLDKNISITTNPLKNSVTCWEQAVIYLDHPVALQDGEDIELQLSCVDNKLKINIVNRTQTCEYCYRVSPEIITFLNDTEIVDAAINLEFPDEYKENNSQILDLNPFPLFALCMAKKGYPGRYKYVFKDLQDLEFMNYILLINLYFYNSNANYRTIFEPCDSSQLEDHLLEQSLDLIFINPISRNGTLCENTFQKLPKLNSALKNDGLILPMLMKLQIEIIDSNYLNFCSKVDDENLAGFSAAKEMNEYAVLEQWQVEPQYYNRKTLSSFNELCINFQNNYENLSTSSNVSIQTSGVANGLLYGYMLEFSKTVHINTFNSFHYSSACFIFKQPQSFINGDVIKVNLKLEQGLLQICCTDDEINDNI